jgi:hypothetical protein
LLAKGVANVVRGITNTILGAMPEAFKNSFFGQWVVNWVKKVEQSFIDWIQPAAEAKKVADDAAAAAAAAASGGGGGAVPAVPSDRAGNQSIVQGVANGYGWGSGGEWDALVKLIMRESGFNNNAQNPTSTAYGMFQFLDSTWAGFPYGKTSDPYKQAVDGLLYIKQRYGDPLGAWSHETSAGWYGKGGPLDLKGRLFDSGGWLRPGTTIAQNNTGKSEAIIPNPVTALRRALD